MRSLFGPRLGLLMSPCQCQWQQLLSLAGGARAVRGRARLLEWARVSLARQEQRPLDGGVRLGLGLRRDRADHQRSQRLYPLRPLLDSPRDARAVRRRTSSLRNRLPFPLLNLLPRSAMPCLNCQRSRHPLLLLLGLEEAEDGPGRMLLLLLWLLLLLLPLLLAEAGVVDEAVVVAVDEGEEEEEGVVD